MRTGSGADTVKTQGDGAVLGTVVLGGGKDLAVGGTGDDTINGGDGADTFVLMRMNGDDVITDFVNGAGGGTTFLKLGLLGGEGSVLIEGLAFTQADASDFIL